MRTGQLAAGTVPRCGGGAKLAGFAGALRVIAEWVTRRRNDERTATGAARPRKCTPSARAIARMMTTERGLLSKTVTRTLAIIEGAIPALVVARDLSWTGSTA